MVLVSISTFYRVLSVKSFYCLRYRLTVGKVKMSNSDLYPRPPPRHNPRKGRDQILICGNTDRNEVTLRPECALKNENRGLTDGFSELHPDRAVAPFMTKAETLTGCCIKNGVRLKARAHLQRLTES